MKKEGRDDYSVDAYEKYSRPSLVDAGKGRVWCIEEAVKKGGYVGAKKTTAMRG